MHKEEENVTESDHESIVNPKDIVLNPNDHSSPHFKDLKSYRDRNSEHATDTFFHWHLYKDRADDEGDFLRNANLDSYTDILMWLLYFSPSNNLSGNTISNYDIHEGFSKFLFPKSTTSI